MIRKTKALGRSVLVRNVRLRMAVRRLWAWGLYLRYRWHARGGVDDRLIVFESFVGRSYAGSPRALYESMLDDPRFADYRFAWAFRDPERATKYDALQDPRTSIVAMRSTGYYRAFGNARVWISNSILAPELVPREQLYVQTWHGTGIKRIGYDVAATAQMAMSGKAELDDRYRIEAKKIDLFLSPAPFGTTVFASAFGFPAPGPGNPLVETGNPRNDALVAATPAQVATARARLEIPDGACAVLYAPTFRDDQYDPRTGYVRGQPFDLETLAAALAPSHVILLRSHYLVSESTDLRRYGGSVRDVSAVDEVNDLLLASDVLVTDYSSVCFDFALLDRPMIFYVYDLDRYGNDLRGFYFPVEDLPGPLVGTQDELVAALSDPRLSARWARRRKEVRDLMCPQDDGLATSRTLDLILARLSS
ncbi:MAG: CDP-glycerol glycerophosphotransferase family protein [Jatrophihabitans sp.]